MSPEEHWLTAESGSDLLDAHAQWFEERLGSRKASLLVIAHARLVWPTLLTADRNAEVEAHHPESSRASIDRCAAALDVCERFLEGQASAGERDAVLDELRKFDQANHGPFLSLALGRATDCATGAFTGNLFACYSPVSARADDTERALAALLRDVFGNPFRPVAFSPSWRTEAAGILAHQMYDSRDFGAMPILADAIQDAGCEDEAILSHCRDANQVHVRGCWVVDLVLGKE